MNIENEILKRCKVDYPKLERFGFQKIENKYIYQKNFKNNTFQAIITIEEDGRVSGKVIDLEMMEEYTNIRIKTIGEFASSIKQEYEEILRDIKKNCFIERPFIFDQTNRINNYIINKYHNEPEFLWERTPGCGVYRNEKNKKWYGIIMNIDYSKLEKKTGEVEVINIKLQEETIQKLLKKKGFYKAYHMNKKDWITIVLDDTLKDNEITSLIDQSYQIINQIRR